MNVKNKLMGLLYSSLVGLNLGFVLTLVLSRWTWLEMRFNTGLIIILGLIIGILFGVLKGPFRKAGLGLGSVVLLILTALLVGKGNPAAALTVSGALFREGILLPDISLNTANIVMGLIIVGTGYISWLLKGR